MKVEIFTERNFQFAPLR